MTITAMLRRLATAWRIGWTLVSICAVQGVVCGVAVLPVVVAWMGLHDWLPARTAVRAAVFSFILVPSYIAFATALMLLSAVANRVTGLRTPRDVEMRIADMDWRLMKWAQYMVAIHLVRVLAGSLFCGSPIWTVYLRLNGARLGRRVYVNTVFISDHNLLEFGDDVVIGAEVHLSGHTVEDGRVKTGEVRLGDGVTVGLGSVIDIGVDIGPRCQIGALSLVPKRTTLPGESVYVGVPVRRLNSSAGHPGTSVATP
jgi:acetyltransferase-like isoleucine patch superfamily enzyme